MIVLPKQWLTVPAAKIFSRAFCGWRWRLAMKRICDNCRKSEPAEASTRPPREHCAVTAAACADDTVRSGLA